MRLDRFLDEQKDSYEIALKEIKAGRKKSHWMWYIFPQSAGLDYSSTAQYYAIKDLDEAIKYVNHPVLGKRLVEISETLLQVDSNDAERVLGYPDNLKLRSSMTLFYFASGNDVFKKVIDKFFDGKMDQRTVDLLKMI